MGFGYLTHQQKVLRLYKKSLRHLESWCIFRDKYRFYACLLRARFDENKNEKDMVKATRMLKAAEEEFWANQHPQPYLFPDSPGGTSYERYDCYKVPEWCLDYWHPSEKAMYPDYFAKREQWKKLREQSWDREVQQLQEETPASGPQSEALPPAHKEGDLPLCGGSTSPAPESVLSEHALQRLGGEIARGIPTPEYPFDYIGTGFS